ncbi:MAG: hypothetical protein H0W61_03375 [Bacteroidetes bacterium]|nr:hypothetical protein [Bacteroidota bacterium]
MELVFKLPDGKPPFIGVVFKSANEAAQVNQDLVNYYKDCSFKLLIETGDTIKLKFICDEPPLSREYRDLTFNLQKFVSWLHYSENKKINFSHIIRQKEKETVVRTLKDNKLFVLSVAKFELLNN